MFLKRGFFVLSETSLTFISFINYFMIPVISLRIYCKRHSIEWKVSLEVVYKYILMCVLNLPVGRVCASVVGRILETSILAESTKYTVLALVVAVIIPYAVEVFEKLVKVEVEIAKVEKQKKSEKQNEN